MEWWLTLLIIFGSLMLLMATGLPVAFCFMAINIVGVFILWGGEAGLRQLTSTMWFSVSRFNYLPVVMFILMGELAFRSGMATRAIDAVEKWLGRLPGRLALLAVLVGTILSTMSGSTVATTALLGGSLLPDMYRRGYKSVMSIGSIVASGGLAMMIPPSSIAVVWASLAEVSAGKVLIAIIIPGLLMAFNYAVYIIGRCWLQPSIAPAYDVAPVLMSVKLKETSKYVLPLSLIVFMVTGLILLGVATPSEAAVMGALGAVILAAAYGKLNWTLWKDSVVPTAKMSVMILMIVSGAQAFSQVLAYTGATRAMIQSVVALQLPPLVVVAGMMFILLIMGMFMGGLAMMMITLPIFMPIIRGLDLSPVWFGVIFLQNMEIGHTTPPFGMQLFVMQGVAPKGTTFVEIINATLPFTLLDIFNMTVVMVFPILALWLPSLML